MDGCPVKGWEGGGASGPQANSGELGGGGGGASSCSRGGEHVILLDGDDGDDNEDQSLLETSTKAVLLEHSLAMGGLSTKVFVPVK